MTDNKLPQLVEIMKKLRAPDGCPWDREQSTRTLVPYIIEEAYEVVGAIEAGSSKDLKEELGDLMFQIVFASELASEKDEFDINDVIAASIEKMTRRHPHVFGEAKVDNSEEVMKRWEEIKKQEGNGEKTGGHLSGVTESFPALLRAHKLTEKAAKVGFDWKDTLHVLDKLTEELAEFREAILMKDAKKTEEEIGDLLFTLVNVSRFVQVNPEEALRKTVGKFMHRFNHIEKTLEQRGLDISSSSTDEMEKLWEEAKRLEKEK